MPLNFYFCPKKHLFRAFLIDIYMLTQIVSNFVDDACFNDYNYLEGDRKYV